MELGNYKKEAIRLVSITSFSGILIKFMSLPLSIINAHILGPSLLGSLRIFDLVRGYVNYNSFGLLQAMTRQIPISMGKKDDKESEYLQDNIFSANVITMGFSLVVLWILFLSGINFKGIFNYVRLTILTATLILVRIDSYLNCYMKSVGAFSVIARQTVIVSWVSPFLLVSLVILRNLDGALLAGMIIHIIGIAIFITGTKVYMPRWRLEWHRIKELSSVGIKVFVNRVAENIFLTIDTTIIAFLLLPEQLGLFSFAWGITALSFSLTSMLTTMISRHMLHVRGKYGLQNGLGFLRKYLENPLTGYITLNTIFIVSLCFGCIVIVKLFLPKYLGALPCLLILGLGQVFFTASYIPSFSMEVIDQMERRFLITVGALVFNGILDFVLIRAGYGIVGAAWASTISFIMYGVIIITLVRYQAFNSIIEPVKYILKITSITLATFLLLYILQHRPIISFLNYEEFYLKVIMGLVDTIIKCVLVSMFVLISYVFTFRQDGLYQEFLKIFTYFLSYIRGVIPALRYNIK